MDPDERDDILGLIEATGMFTPAEVAVAEELIDIYLERPGQKDYDVVVMEDENGEIAGYMTWGPTPLTEGTYDLYWMAVSPAKQGRGCGRALLRWLEDRVRERDGRMILVETSSQPKYGPTREFYVKQEYREVARVPDFYREGDDRVIYSKYVRE